MARRKTNFANTFPRLIITPQVCVMLGKSEQEIARMGMEDLACLVFDKGLDISVTSQEAAEGNRGHLTITADTANVMAKSGESGQ